MAVPMVDDLSLLEDPDTDESAPRREWPEARTMSLKEPVVPFHARRTSLKVAAYAAVFVAGVAGTWKLWHGEKPAPSEAGKSLAFLPEAAVKSRPGVLVKAIETLPPPADDIPAAPPAVVGAVARNVSTAPSARVSVPAVVEPVTLFPDTGDTAQGKPSVPVVKNAETPQISAEEREIRRVVPAKGSLSAPGNTLIKFFAAKTWQERSQYVLAPQRVKPLMETYYKVNKDGPVVPEDIELHRMDPVDDDPTRHYYAFLVYFKDRPAGVPISVEETKAGPLVEWTSFTEGKDMLLEKFYSAYRKEPGTFRALIRRGHYFEKDVPDQEGRMVFDINPPDRTGPYKLWLDRNTVTAEKYFLENRFTWTSISMMVLTLQWERTASGVEYVRLRDVAAGSWHPEEMPAK